MGLSENSVPLHPMVLLIIIPTKWLFHWGYTPFSDIPLEDDHPEDRPFASALKGRQRHNLSTEPFTLGDSGVKAPADMANLYS